MQSVEALHDRLIRGGLTDMKCPPSSGLLLPASFLERLMVEETEEGLFDD